MGLFARYRISGRRVGLLAGAVFLSACAQDETRDDVPNTGPRRSEPSMLEGSPATAGRLRALRRRFTLASPMSRSPAAPDGADAAPPPVLQPGVVRRFEKVTWGNGDQLRRPRRRHFPTITLHARRSASVAGAPVLSRR